MTGSARLTQESRDLAEMAAREEEISRQWRTLENRRKTLEAQIAALQSEFDLTAQETQSILEQAKQKQQRVNFDRDAMAISRHAGSTNLDRGVHGSNRRSASRRRK